MEPVTNNIQKGENYREQMKRLKKALQMGFNLEAIFIEYAILEDRLESVIRHSGKWNYDPGRHVSLEAKVKKIKKMAEEKKGLARKYFSDELMDSVVQWKEKRNPLIHALMKQVLQSEEPREIALEGQEILKQFKSKADAYNRALAKLNQEAV